MFCIFAAERKFANCKWHKHNLRQFFHRLALSIFTRVGRRVVSASGPPISDSDTRHTVFPSKSSVVWVPRQDKGQSQKGCPDSAWRLTGIRPVPPCLAMPMLQRSRAQRRRSDLSTSKLGRMDVLRFGWPTGFLSHEVIRIFSKTGWKLGPWTH